MSLFSFATEAQVVEGLPFACFALRRPVKLFIVGSTSPVVWHGLEVESPQYAIMSHIAVHFRTMYTDDQPTVNQLRTIGDHAQ